MGGKRGVGKQAERKESRQEGRDVPFLHPYREKSTLQQIFFCSYLECGKIS